MTIAQKFFGGDYTIYPNLLRLEAYAVDVFKIANLEFRGEKGNVISSDNLVINEDGSIMVTVYTKMEKKSIGDSFISILPCDYILCNYRPVITDTLKIKY